MNNALITDAQHSLLTNLHQSKEIELEVAAPLIEADYRTVYSRCHGFQIEFSVKVEKVRNSGKIPFPETIGSS